MRLALPDVTLVMVDTRHHDVVREVARDCIAKIEFGAVLIFSDRVLDIPGAQWRYVADAPTKLGWEQQFWYEPPPLLRTSHMLYVEWDARITNPAMWTDEFLRYDYIGAPWPGQYVGGGGLSLRSTALLKFLWEHRDTFPCREPGDTVLCRRYRPKLELLGFRWAPHQLASRLSIDHVRPGQEMDRFGYHQL